MSEPLIDVTGARKRRARARLIRRLRLAGFLTVVLALVGGGVWLFHGSPWLAVREVRVTGTALTSVDEIKAAAAVPIGAPLAGVDTGAVAARVGELPAVAEAKVSRAWPDALAVEVTEERPVVVLEAGRRFVWVSGEGQVFHSSADRPEGVLLARADVGDEAKLVALARVAGDLPEAVRRQATLLRAATVDSITVTLSDNRQVWWGSAEDGELKASVIVGLLGVKAREYDVSAPTHPTTK
ncbi:MAG: FtsQ-type POTRA domain-containing protein [Propioniciclava sp.]|uniref:cell division protein FtsQ/DivIB n=1 Tax=Propioniciclava sp. TaxID=2038686 RepID=UPI0039E53A68